MLRWQEVGSRRSRLILTALIFVVAMANLPLNMVNVAIPSIGDYFNATQTQLNMVAVAYSLGLACSVLWLGALGDRYGRRLLMLLGVTLTIPGALISAFAPIVAILIIGRLLSGFAAGMAYPTTLSLITALWAPGLGRTRAIAIWVGTGTAITVSGPLLSGMLLEYFSWGSIFLIIIPIAVAALVMGLRYIPAHINESSKPVDNVGGILSLVLIGTFVLALNFLPFPGYRVWTTELLLVSFGTAVLFLHRQRRATNPLYDLAVASRRIFWVASLAGLIVFGSLMGGMYVGQQFFQFVLGYSTVEAGLAVIPLGVFILLAARGSARIINAYGTRLSLLVGFAFLLMAYVLMLLFWNENTSYPTIGITYTLLGLGIGLAGTPSSRSLSGSVPIRRAGMASATADLQRDLGGAMFQSLFGALLAAGYTTAMASLLAVSPAAAKIPDAIARGLELSYSSAQAVAEQYPQYAAQITEAAENAFSLGGYYAHLAGVATSALGLLLVFFFFPKHHQEQKMLAEFLAEDKDYPTSKNFRSG